MQIIYVSQQPAKVSVGSFVQCGLTHCRQPTQNNNNNTKKYNNYSDVMKRTQIINLNLQSSLKSLLMAVATA